MTSARDQRRAARRAEADRVASRPAARPAVQDDDELDTAAEELVRGTTHRGANPNRVAIAQDEYDAYTRDAGDAGDVIEGEIVEDEEPAPAPAPRRDTGKGKGAAKATPAKDPEPKVSTESPELDDDDYAAMREEINARRNANAARQKAISEIPDPDTQLEEEEPEPEAPRRPARTRAKPEPAPEELVELETQRIMEKLRTESGGASAQRPARPVPQEDGSAYVVDQGLVEALKEIRGYTLADVDQRLDELHSLLAMRDQAITPQQKQRLTLLVLLQIKQDW